MALSYIRGKVQGEVSSAREISDYFDLPFEILAKTLQRLKEQGMISSSYGTRGGYILARDLKAVNLADFLTMMEGPLSVVACAPQAPSVTQTTESNCGCEYQGNCNIKPVMSAFNDRLYDFLHRISLEELTRGSAKSAAPTTISLSNNSASALAAASVSYGEEP
jgi:Rrf2 family protein